MTPFIEGFYDEVTGTVTYVVYDEVGGHAAIIDPVLNFDPKAGRTQTHSVDQVIAFVGAKNLTVDWILETHVHADHLSSASHLKEQLGGRIGIGEHIKLNRPGFSRHLASSLRNVFQTLPVTADC